MNFNSLKSQLNKPNSLYLILILILAFILRIIFFNGTVFSDDSYYNQLSLTLLNGQFGEDYLGYPIFLIRKAQLTLTAVSFFLFGTSEFSSVLLPFLLSLASIILVYKFILLLNFGESQAVIGAFLYALFPTDVIFASINFADLQSAFFINLGLYYLYKAWKNDDIKPALLAGMFFSLSLLFKENLLFVLVLLAVLIIYLYFFRRILSLPLFAGIGSVFLYLILEGVVYWIFNGNPDYRFSVLNKNYAYCYYDFFPYTLLGAEYTTDQYRMALIKQIFFLNPKYLFLRRFYLGIPLLALFQSIWLLRERREKILVYWGVGLIILLLTLSTSFTEYKPFDLRRSWYIYAALMPFIILSAGFISRFNYKLKTAGLALYALASFWMCSEYQIFFNISEKSQLKDFVKNLDQSLIYTDHHTQYGLNTINENNDIKIILGRHFDISNIPAGSFVIYNKNVIDELKKQGYSYPDFSSLEEDIFELRNNFGEFHIYGKN